MIGIEPLALLVVLGFGGLTILVGLVNIIDPSGLLFGDDFGGHAVELVELLLLPCLGLLGIVVGGFFFVAPTVAVLEDLVGRWIPVSTVGAVATWLLAGYVLVSPLVDAPSIDRAEDRFVAYRTVTLGVGVSVLGWFVWIF